MVIAIIAGGSGTRLWPLSQPNYPKHLLRLTSENSLLQETYSRAKQLTDKIYVITEASHAAEIRLQVPQLPVENIIVEPARRGTASCIALALAWIERDYPEETVVFLHADHYITDTAGFARTVQAAAGAAGEEGMITLIGLKPTYPATGFGYIHSGPEHKVIDGLSINRVKRFVEKPDYPTAKQYVESGDYLWNLGLFAAPIPVFAENMQAHAPELHGAYQKLAQVNSTAEAEQVYLSLPSQPIDTALIEKTPNLLMVPGEFDWADIGSFMDLHKILQDKDTNSVKGEVYQLDCSDSMIHGADKPVIAVGLEGVVVIDTPEGLLVCSKEKSQMVGEMAKKLQSYKENHK